jgi:hypothetical protein
MPMNPNMTLSKGQHPPTTANIAKMNDIPFPEGIGPLMHTLKPNNIAINAIILKFCEEPPKVSLDKSRGGGGTSCINARKYTRAATHLEAAKHDFQDLEGEGGISLVSEEEKNLLPDPGGVPQQRKVGYRPMVDGRPIPRTPRKRGQCDVDDEGRGRSEHDSCSAITCIIQWSGDDQQWPIVNEIIISPGFCWK